MDHGYVQKTSTSKLSSPIKPWENSDIKFYNQYEQYYEFTNFSLYPIKLDGKEWPTTEHYFQAQKFIGTPYAEAIRKQPYPRGAFDMSRNPSVSRWKRGDWHQVKDDVMLKCLRAKFTQHKDLKKMLLDTGERNLIEHTFNDSYWGDGGDGSGQNKLGKLLMQVRKELSKQTHAHKATNQSSLDCSINREKSQDKKKHRRRNSISGITVTAPAVLGTQPALTISRRQKFKSTENLHHPSLSAEKGAHSSFGRVKQQCSESLTSYNHTQFKQTHDYKATNQSNLDCSINREKSQDKKKHRRHNSIGGITVTAPAVLGTQPALTISSQKFKSTENLHHPSLSAEKGTHSSFGRVKQQCGESLTSYSHTQFKPIVRSSSLGDLHQRSSNSHLSSLSVYGWASRVRDTTKIYRSNESSVPYNIINNQ